MKAHRKKDDMQFNISIPLSTLDFTQAASTDIRQAAGEDICKYFFSVQCTFLDE